MSATLVDGTGAGCAVDEEEFADLVAHVLAGLHIDPAAEVTITLVDEDAMAQLHERWMDLPGPTDVMSFPMDELVPGTPDEPTPAGVLGDVVLCPTVARAQAEAAGHPEADELLLLTVHGILHLLGHDHVTAEEERVMFELQRDLLLSFLTGRGRTTTAAPEPGRQR